MKYFLDSVNEKEIIKWWNVIDGVTSNPHLLKEEGITTEKFATFMYQQGVAVGSQKKVFIQVSTLEEIEKLSIYKNDIIYKISMHPSLYPIIKTLTSYGKSVAATTMYDIVQINQAIEFGCEYTMVYKHKNEYDNLFNDTYKLKQLTGSKIKLVGASFRNKEEVEDAILSGMDYATVRPEHLELVFKNDQLEKDFSVLYK